MMKIRTLKAAIKAAKPALGMVETIGSALVVGQAVHEYGPKAMNVILDTLGIKRKRPGTGGAVDFSDHSGDDCALSTSELVLEVVADEPCGCGNGTSTSTTVSTAPGPVAVPAPLPPPVVVVPHPTPCSVSTAASPPPAPDSPTKKWVKINGRWLPGAGYECSNGEWIFRPVIVPRPKATPTTTTSTVIRGADGSIDVCPYCAQGPIIAGAGERINVIACLGCDAIARDNAKHAEAMTLGWAQAWGVDLGATNCGVRPDINDKAYTSWMGRFKADKYMRDLRAYQACIQDCIKASGGNASIAKGEPAPGTKTVAIAAFALNTQKKRFADQIAASQAVLDQSPADEQAALQAQIDAIQHASDQADKLMDRLKGDPSDADVQKMAQDIATAAGQRGGLDAMFRSIQQAEQAAIQGVSDFAGPNVDDDVCNDAVDADVAAALGIPDSMSADDATLLFAIQQNDDFSDADLDALSNSLAAGAELGCTTGCAI